MKTFKKRWNGKIIDDWITVNSDEMKSFARTFRNMLKRELPRADVLVKPGHYDVSGFIVQDEMTEYIRYSVRRGEPIDFSKGGAWYGVLYRDAKNAFDYTGGYNAFVPLEELPDALRARFEQRERGFTFGL